MRSPSDSDLAAADPLSDDGFVGGRLRVLQPRDGYRAAMDPVLLAAFVAARPGETALDLGCGAGVAGLCLALRVAGVAVTGLERQPLYAGLARRNAARNALEMEVVEGDLAEMPAGLRARSFDHVLANPPYYLSEAGPPARDAGRDAARRERTPLATWIDAAARRLKPGGSLSVVLNAERLPALIAACDGRLGSLVLLPLAARAGRPAGRILLRARKGGRSAFRLCAPLVLHEGESHADGDNLTPEARAVLREGSALSPGFD